MQERQEGVRSMTVKKVLGIGVLGVLAATLVLTLAMTTQTMDNDESNATTAATTGITNPAMAQQANSTTADDGELALMIVRAATTAQAANTAGNQASTEVAGMAIFMGDDEDNEGLLKGPVAFFMTDEASGEVTEVDNPADGNMVGVIHTPTADNPDVAFIHNAQLICEI